MPRDYATMPRSQVRRRDRTVADPEWIRVLLQRAPVGTLATTHDGQPFVNTNLFVYDEAAHAIYMHTARVGRTRANLGHGAPVCFTVHTLGRLLPAATALEFSVEYAGVVVFGQGAAVTDVAEARHGLELLLAKYAPHLQPGRDYQPIADPDLRRTAVYRIQIEEWTGKQKTVAADFPGAYYYRAAGPVVPGAGGAGLEV